MELPNIFIVDDSKLMLFLYEKELKGYYTLFTFESAEAMFEILNKNQSLPDLIILDILLHHGMDGYEACHRLKSNIKWHKIPVIFVSVLEDDDSKYKAFEVGGADYIHKPFETHELFKAIINQLQIHKIQKEIINTLDEIKATQTRRFKR